VQTWFEPGEVWIVINLWNSHRLIILVVVSIISLCEILKEVSCGLAWYEMEMSTTTTV
jgi:hypothetical protein